MKLRFEEKAKLRQRLLEATTKTKQTSWMLVEWVRSVKLYDILSNEIKPTKIIKKHEHF